jgi:uncharacterized protein (TIGR02271 family)
VAGKSSADDRRVVVHGQDVRVDQHRGELPHAEVRSRFGGLDPLAVLAGFTSALGALVALSALLGAAGVAGGGQVDRESLGVAGLVAGTIALGLSLLLGGYVAGRVARYSGLLNGLLAAVAFVLVTAALSALAAREGADRFGPAGVARPRHRHHRSPGHRARGARRRAGRRRAGRSAGRALAPPGRRHAARHPRRWPHPLPGRDGGPDGRRRRRAARPQEGQPAMTDARDHAVEDATVQLSEEQLRVGTERTASGAVRARKHVDTETVHRTVPRGVEHADVDRVGVVGEDSGQVETLPDGSLSIPVFEEQLVVEKRMVVRERIVVRKHTVFEEHEVTADLRRERLEVTTDGDVEVEDRR